MVQINFAKRQMLVNFAVVAPDPVGARAVLHALAASFPGEHDPVTASDASETVVLRPRDFVFDMGPPSQNSEAVDALTSRGTFGEMHTDFALTAVSRQPPGVIDGLLFVCDGAQALESHRACLETVCARLREVGLQPETLPTVFLWTRGAPEAEAYAALERTVCPGARSDVPAVPSYAGEPGEAALQAFARLGGGGAAEAQQAVLLLHVRPRPPATSRRGPPRPRERGVGVGPRPRVPTSGTPSQRGDLPDGSTTLSA